jgi:hypothetical protein
MGTLNAWEGAPEPPRRRKPNLRRQPRKARTRRQPEVEALEVRNLLAFAQGSVLTETFDDVNESSATLSNGLALYDTQTSPPTYTPTSTVLFQHQFINGTAPFITLMNNDGTTTVTGLPRHALQMEFTQDLITFPSVNPTSQQIIMAELDVQREGGGAIPVEFQGTGGNETVTDMLGTTMDPPSFIVGTPTGGSTVSARNPSGTPGWDTLTASSDDILPNGNKLGAITGILVENPVYLEIDNVRAVIGPAPASPSPSPSPSPTVTPNPTPSTTPAAPAPHVTAIASVRHPRSGLKQITVAFDESLVAGSATTSSFYSLLGGVRRRGRLVFTRALGIGRISYDGNVTVTLNLARPYTGQVQVTVHGGITASNGAMSSGDVTRVVM